MPRAGKSGRCWSRPQWHRAFLRLEGQRGYVHQGARDGAGSASHQRQLDRARTRHRAPRHLAVSGELLTILVRQIPWGRAGTAADIAQAALFLASPEADFTTGKVLSAEGVAGTGRTSLQYSHMT